MNTYSQPTTTALQTATLLQQPQPPNPPTTATTSRAASLDRLPPQIEQALKQQLVRAAIRSGKEISKELQEVLLTQVFNLAKTNNPAALRERLLELYLSESEADHWQQSLTVLQQATVLQMQSDPFGLAATELDANLGQAPGQESPDPFLFGEMFKLFCQFGYAPEIAQEWAAYVTPGFMPSRPLTPEEIEAINACQNDPTVRDLVEPALAEPLKRSVWARIFADDSPISHLVLIGLLLTSYILVWQVATRLEALRWANCSATQTCKLK